MRRVFFAMLLLMAVAFVGCSSAAKSVVVGSDSELEAVLSGGEVIGEIIVRDGVYDSFRVRVERSGSAGAPLVIRAETPGGVVVEDNALVEIAGSYVELRGFYFRDGAENRGMDSGAPVVNITGDHNRVTECVFFECHNRASIASMYVEAEDRMPQYTRIDHCYFADNLGWRLYLDLGQRVPSDDLKYAMYYRIDHNYFSTPYKMGGNTGSSMRIGLGQLGYGRCLIDNNLFERQDGETELIENKSHENVYINNTFRNCRAQMSFRQGHRTIFLHNQLEATDSKYRYGGLGMWMDNHVVAGNYFSFPHGSFTSLDRNMREREDRQPPAVVQFISGYKNFQHHDGSYASHLAVQGSLFANNTLFECMDSPLNMAFLESDMSRFADYQNSLPFDNEVLANTFAYDEVAQPELIQNSDGDNSIEGNILFTVSNASEESTYKISDMPQIESAQGWLPTIAGVSDGDFDLYALANSRVAEVVRRGDALAVERSMEALKFGDVGPEWLDENPSAFARSGEYSEELVQTLRRNILGR